MNFDSARACLLQRPEAFEDFPFGPDVYVYKIANKMFATLGTEADVARRDRTHDRSVLRSGREVTAETAAAGAGDSARQGGAVQVVRA